MLESCKRFGDIFGHGEVKGVVFVIPMEVGTTEYFAIFVDGDVVMFL
jgi:hypothetical protein